MQIGHFGPGEWLRHEKGPESTDFLDLLLYEKGVRDQSGYLIIEVAVKFGPYRLKNEEKV